jgi:hypothetical protein
MPPSRHATNVHVRAWFTPGASERPWGLQHHEPEIEGFT